MEEQASLPQVSKGRWIKLFALLCIGEAVTANVLRSAHPILTCIGGAIGVLLIAFPLSLFAKREKRFYVCCCIAVVVACLIYIKRWGILTN